MSVGIEGGPGAPTSKGESRRLKGSADKGGGRGEARGLELVPEPPGARRGGQHAGGTATERDKRVFVQNWVRAQHAKTGFCQPSSSQTIPFGTAHGTWPRHRQKRQGVLRQCLRPPRG